MMKRKTHRLAALLLILLLAASACALAEGVPALTREEIAERALLEMEADGDIALRAKLRSGDGHRMLIHRWPAPEEESVRGETWYVRFDALDRENEASYIVGLNEDGELRWLDMEPAGKDRAGLGNVSFPDVYDRYTGLYGPVDQWNQAVFISFATEMRKGSPDTRNAWRFQQASFVPVPEDAISREEACRLAAESAGYPAEEAAMCVCLENGERLIYKVSLTAGHGWEHMVELDCRTGEVLLSIPYQPGTHSWSDCCVPDSVTQAVPPAEDFLTNA